MLRSFADKRTANIFNGIREGSFPATLVEQARSNLDRINYATNINDLRVPLGNCLEGLKGEPTDTLALEAKAHPLRLRRRDRV